MDRFAKIDCAIENGFKRISYLSGFLTFIIAIVVTINIITTKLFSWSIPSATEWVSYLFCGMFYFAISYVKLSQGLVAVDILSVHFPPVVNDIITIFSDLAAAALYGMIGYYALPLLQKNLNYHVMSSTGTGAFPLWPFNGIVMVFSTLFAFTMIWHIVRLLVYRQHGERPTEWSAGKPGSHPGKEDA